MNMQECGAARGGGPAGPQNVVIHPALGTRRIAILLIDTSFERTPTGPAFDTIRKRWINALINSVTDGGVTRSPPPATAKCPMATSICPARISAHATPGGNAPARAQIVTGRATALIEVAPKPDFDTGGVITLGDRNPLSRRAVLLTLTQGSGSKMISATRRAKPDNGRSALDFGGKCDTVGQHVLPPPTRADCDAGPFRV